MSGFSNIKALFTNELWKLDTSEASSAWRKVVRFTKLIRIMFESFLANRMGFQCVALCYYMTLAIVPFLAFIFAVTNGLGLEGRVEVLLYQFFPKYPEIVSLLSEKATNIIAVAKSGGVGAIGALFFLWTIFWMMFQVERVFNNVWGIQKVPRTFLTRLSFYVALLLLTPFVIMVFSFGVVFYTRFAGLLGLNVDGMSASLQWIGATIFYILAVFGFSAMYKFIPAAKVKYIFALKSAAVSALAFTVFQYLYLGAQIFVNRLNVIYGAIATIPLFLIWLNFSWQIIIYGAQLTFGYHNIDTYHIPEWDSEITDRSKGQ